jgi:hypothetical protein
VLIFVEPPETEGINRPVRELRDFGKVFLAPGDEKTLTFNLTDRAFAIWNDGWVIPKGTYTIHCGDLTASIFKDGDSFTPKNYTIPAPKILPNEKGKYTINNSPSEMRNASFELIIFNEMIKKVAESRFKPGTWDYRLFMDTIVDGPLRNLMIGGGIKTKYAYALVAAANGKKIGAVSELLEL